MKKISSPLRWYLECYYLLPVLILSCLAFNTWEGKHYISRLIVVMLVVACYMSRQVIKNNFQQSVVKNMVVFWLVIAAVFSLFYIFRGESFSIPRTILVSLVYLVIVPWENISRRYALLAIIMGGGAAGVLSLYEHVVLGITRVGGVINQIPFALYAAITLIIAVYALATTYKIKWMKSVTWLALAGSTFAIIMSEARGVWLALVCVAVFYVLSQLKKLTIGKASLMVTIAIMTFFALSSIAEVERRISETKIEFFEIANGNPDTSIGIRLQLWRSAMDIIKSHPVMGAGTYVYKDEMLSQHQQGLITSAALFFKDAHFHNQYLDSYVRYGIIGLMLVISIFLSPIVLNYLIKSDFFNINVSITALLFLAGLTDVPLMHTGVLYIIVLYPAVIAFSKK